MGMRLIRWAVRPITMGGVLLVLANLVLLGCTDTSAVGGQAHEAAVRAVGHIDPDSDEPDEILLAARARLQLALLDDAHRNAAQDLLERLAELAREHEGRASWGLSYAWDAFQDDVTNPADTIYSYTTAAAAHAFLDGYVVLDDDRWLDWAERAGTSLMVDTCCWEDDDGLSVWYSDQENDQQDGRQVHNVTGLALGVLDRLAQFDVQVGDDDVTARMAARLLRRQGQGWTRPDDTAATNWPYRDGDDVANDLIHETFIVDGLLWLGSDEAVEAARRSLAGIWSNHFGDDGAPRYDRHHTAGSNDWGPPAGLYVLTGPETFRDEARRVAEQLTGQVGEDGWPAPVDPDHLRGTAWYALALARYAAVDAGVRDLLPTAVR